MSSSAKTTKSPSTSLTTETSLSLLYRVLRTVIRPLRPRLVKPGKPQPAGSPRLSNHPGSKNGCHIIERQNQDTKLWLYDIVPNSQRGHRPGTNSKHLVLYFAGGGFQSTPSGEHWSFVSTLAAHPSLSSSHDFTIVSYPLAPNSPACDSLPLLRRFLMSVCNDASRSASKVTVMGDSAGGNIALSLGLWWVDQQAELAQTAATTKASNGHFDFDDDDDETTITADHANKFSLTDPRLPKDTSTSVLSNVLVISPAADLRNTNPAIKQADLHDPVLSMSLTEQTATAWTRASNSTSAASSSRSDPYISPVMVSSSTLQRVKSSGIWIHGIFGTHDVLAPDAELFRQKCVEHDVPGDWLVWEGQMHCFVLAGVYGMMEGKKGIQWVVDVLAGNL